MMNVMIIDDDENIRQRLKSIIDWDGLGANLVCEAGDSESAMEQYLLFRPKIVIADIRIPIISGVELAEQMQKEDPEIRFIIITGYNDFDMAKRAVSLCTISLLSKPIQPEEINESIKKAICQIEDARAKLASLSTLQRLVDNNLEQIQKNYLENLLRRIPENPGLVAEKLWQLKIPCSGPNYVVELIAMHFPQSEEENEETMLFLLRDLLSAEMEAASCSMFSFVDSHRRLTCMISTDLESPDNIIEESLVRIQEKITNLQDVEIYAGIGPMVTDVAKLHESYDGARTALNYQGVLGNESITHYKNLERAEVVFRSPEPIFHYCIEQFRAGNLSAIERTIQAHIREIRAYPGRNDSLERNFLLEYLTALINEGMRLGLEMATPEQMTKIFSELFQDSTSPKCMSSILAFTDELIGQLHSRRLSSTNQLIVQAKEYIRANLYDKQLSLDQVSKYVGLSKIYFCKLFHQVVGVSFTNYLKDERVELAKKMLLGTDKKVFEISEDAGFSSPKYFGYVFKQVVGLTPLEYQKNAK